MQKNEAPKKYLNYLLPSLSFQGFLQKVREFMKIVEITGFGVFDDEVRLIFYAGLDRTSFESFPRDSIRLQGEDDSWNLLEFSGLYGLFRHYNFEDGHIYTALLIFSKKPAIINDFLDYFCESIVREIVLYRTLQGEFEGNIKDLCRFCNDKAVIFSSKELTLSEYRHREFLYPYKPNFPLYSQKKEYMGIKKYLDALNFIEKNFVSCTRIGFCGENYYVFYPVKQTSEINLIRYKPVKQAKDKLKFVKKSKIVKISGVLYECASKKRSYSFDFYIKSSRQLPEEWKEVFVIGSDKVSENLLKTLQPILSIVKSKDMHTYLHLKNVARLSGIIAYEMGFDESDVFYVQLAGLVHDIGKIVLPLELITKPQVLSEVEIEMVKLHVKYSCDIIKDVDVLREAIIYVKQHHERLDGSGYPEGLKSDEIRPASHAVILADILDAMSSDRPYRRKRTLSEIQEEIEIGKNIKYDPRASEIALKLLQQGLVIFPN